jgi:hypothetical protein
VLFKLLLNEFFLEIALLVVQVEEKDGFLSIVLLVKDWGMDFLFKEDAVSLI